jgi:hypothetical protein
MWNFARAAARSIALDPTQSASFAISLIFTGASSDERH